MKPIFRLTISLAALLLLAGLGYFGATRLMASVTGYRSPIRFDPPSPGLSLGAPITRKVVIVLIDALRLDTSLNRSVMPHLNDLRDQGASATMHSRPPSFSEPGYTTILTGAWPDINDGPPINLDYSEIPVFTQDDLFSAAHRAGLRTAISGYYWFEKLVPQSSVDDHFYTPGEDASADVDVMHAALPMLTGNDRLVLIHLDQVDYAGHHQGGPLDPNWDAAASRVDNDLDVILSTLDLQQDTIIVLSDHGQIDQGGHGGPEPITLIEPFVITGANVRPGKYSDIQMVDVAPTVAALLGANLPASSEGTVQYAMLDLAPEYIQTIQSADYTQKRILFQAYIAAIKSQPLTPPDPANPDSYMLSMESARSRRLASDRVWRVPVAIVLGILPVVILLLRRSSNLGPLVIGGLIYVGLFNFRYAILDNHTYSLSWISSETGFFVYIAITTALALVLAWLVTLLWRRSFINGSLAASLASVDLVFMCIYFLALPVLVSFAVNGFGPTWTLPEFYTIFIALLSFIQICFVAAIGLLLAGLAAFIGHLVIARQTRSESGSASS